MMKNTDDWTLREQLTHDTEYGNDDCFTTNMWQMFYDISELNMKLTDEIANEFADVLEYPCWNCDDVFVVNVYDYPEGHLIEDYENGKYEYPDDAWKREQRFIDFMDAIRRK